MVKLVLELIAQENKMWIYIFEFIISALFVGLSVVGIITGMLFFPKPKWQLGMMRIQAPFKLVGTRARLVSVGTLLLGVSYLALAYSDHISNGTINQFFLTVILGTIIGVPYAFYRKTKYEKQVVRFEEANPIRIRRDY